MADGSRKRIADVQVGDQVKSRDPLTGQEDAKTVTATVQRQAPALVTMALHDAKAGTTETLTCTPEHPFFTQGGGWVEAGSLGIGTSIVTRAGPQMSVTQVTWKRDTTEQLVAHSGLGSTTVYNLTIADDHTFFVGITGGGTWVHNSCTIASASQEEAKAAAFNRAGFPEEEAYEANSPLSRGSQSPEGPQARGNRSEWEHPESEYKVSHDPYGHRFEDGSTTGPHYGVEGGDIDGTEHYTYPSDHDPMTNR